MARLVETTETPIVIDQEHLGRQTAGDTALQLELLKLFLTQLHGVQGALERDRASPVGVSAAELAHVLHRIRGAAAAVGAWELVGSLDRAEQDLGRGQLSSVALNDLRAALHEASTALPKLIAAQETAGLAKGGESR